MDEQGQFNPIKLSVKASTVGVDGRPAEGVAVVAEDAEGRYQGTVVPEEMASLLDEFLPTSGPRFLEFWATYEAERGGDCFFWDLRRMGEAILAAPDLPGLRKLSGARSASDFMHNAYQAQLMALAHGQLAGSVNLLRATGAGKSADFLVSTDEREVRYEVKVVTRQNGLDLLDEGCRISDADREIFIQTLNAKIDDALEQAGRQGVVVVAAWCDSLGMVLTRELSDWECGSDAIFQGGQVVLTCRDEDGRDRWFAFPTTRRTECLLELDARLRQVLPPPFSIPLGASAVSVANSTEWMSVGRTVKLANLQTPFEYTDEQLAPYTQQRPLLDVSIERLLLWQARWSLVKQQAEAFRLAVGTMERRNYSLVEFLGLPGGLALFLWLALLHAALRQAFESEGSTPAPLDFGVLSEDYDSLRDTLGRIGAAFWLGPDVSHVGALIAQVRADNKVFGAISRLTSGYDKILRQEFTARSTNA